MMSFAVYTLTRERLEFTKYTFDLLRAKAGQPFDHYVVDNSGEGCADGTREWLGQERAAGRLKFVHYMPKNMGISIGSNMALAFISAQRYDAVLKFDNDCEVVSDNLLVELGTFLTAAKAAGDRAAVSPRVEGIGWQPPRTRTLWWHGYSFGDTGMIGGLCHCIPWAEYRDYRYPENLPMASGQDGHVCGDLVRRGVTVGYLEDLVVRHYMTTTGQTKHLPEYFERKYQEEKEAPRL